VAGLAPSLTVMESLLYQSLTPAHAGAALLPEPIGFGVTAALMSSPIPYPLELITLRRRQPDTFAILTSLSQVVAPSAGWLGHNNTSP